MFSQKRRRRHNRHILAVLVVKATAVGISKLHEEEVETQLYITGVDRSRDCNTIIEHRFLDTLITETPSTNLLGNANLSMTLRNATEAQAITSRIETSKGANLSPVLVMIYSNML